MNATAGQFFPVTTSSIVPTDTRVSRVNTFFLNNRRSHTHMHTQGIFNMILFVDSKYMTIHIFKHIVNPIPNQLIPMNNVWRE